MQLLWAILVLFSLSNIVHGQTQSEAEPTVKELLNQANRKNPQPLRKSPNSQTVPKTRSTGGELRGYSDLLEQTGNIVLQRMAEKAKAMGADAVIGMRLVTSNVAEGAAELMGYGTAVHFLD